MIRRYVLGTTRTYARSRVLELEHFSASFAKRPVLHDLSLSVYDGQAVAILGDSGAGKTSLLAGIQGRLSPVKGRICLFGVPIPPVPTIVQRQLGSVPIQPSPARRHLDECSLHTGSYTVSDYLHCYAKSLHISLSSHLLEYSIAHHQLRADEPVTGLSLVQRRLLELAATCLQDPGFILLDDPLSALSLPEQVLLTEYMQQLQREGRTLLTTLTPPIAVHLLKMYDGIVQLVQGRFLE